MTGWDHKSLAAMGGRPSLGAAAARLQGPVDPSVPPFVGLAAPTQHMPWSDSGTPGFLGCCLRPLQAGRPRHGQPHPQRRHRSTGLHDRTRLMASFDGLRRDLDADGAVRRQSTPSPTAPSAS